MTFREFHLLGCSPASTRRPRSSAKRGARAIFPVEGGGGNCFVGTCELSTTARSRLIRKPDRLTRKPERHIRQPRLPRTVDSGSRRVNPERVIRKLGKAQVSLSCWKICGSWTHSEHGHYHPSSIYALRSGCTGSSHRLGTDALGFGCRRLRRRARMILVSDALVAWTLSSFGHGCSLLWSVFWMHWYCGVDAVIVQAWLLLSMHWSHKVASSVSAARFPHARQPRQFPGFSYAVSDARFPMCISGLRCASAMLA